MVEQRRKTAFEVVAVKREGRNALSLLHPDLTAILAVEIPGLRIIDFHMEVTRKEGDATDRETITIGHLSRADEAAKRLYISAERATTLETLQKALAELDKKKAST